MIFLLFVFIVYSKGVISVESFNALFALYFSKSSTKYSFPDFTFQNKGLIPVRSAIFGLEFFLN